jgi:hypothetical protein
MIDTTTRDLAAADPVVDGRCASCGSTIPRWGWRFDFAHHTPSCAWRQAAEAASAEAGRTMGR